MLTLASQDLTEFDLHARAILGLPVPDSIAARPAAVDLAKQAAGAVRIVYSAKAD